MKSILFFAIIRAFIVYKSGFQKPEYEIIESTSNGGNPRFTVGYQSSFGFNSWYEDTFSTRSEAEYRLNALLERQTLDKER